MILQGDFAGFTRGYSPGYPPGYPGGTSPGCPPGYPWSTPRGTLQGTPGITLRGIPLTPRAFPRVSNTLSKLRRKCLPSCKGAVVPPAAPSTPGSPPSAGLGGPPGVDAPGGSPGRIPRDDPLGGFRGVSLWVLPRGTPGMILRGVSRGDDPAGGFRGGLTTATCIRWATHLSVLTHVESGHKVSSGAIAATLHPKVL